MKPPERFLPDDDPREWLNRANSNLARRIAERLEIHYTPKHRSWLDMAEIEIGVMVRQCLDRRIPDQSVLQREVAAWQQQRNQDAIRVDWRFTTEDARIKLKSLYPSLQY